MTTRLTPHDVELALADLPVPTWVLDETGTTIVGVAPSATLATRKGPEAFVGRPATSIVVPEESGAFADWIRAGMTHGMTLEALDHSWRVDGVELTGTALRFALIRARWHGKSVIGLAAVRIPNPGEMQTMYVETRHRFRQLVDSLPLAVWTTDRDLRFTSMEGSLVKIPAGRYLGLPLEEHMQGDPSADDAVRAHKKALEGHSAEFEGEVRGCVWHSQVGPLRDPKGDIVGVIGLCHDVTQERVARKELQESRERLRLLAHRLQSVREEEQRRISREIHDQIGGTISLLRVELSRLAARLGPGHDAEREIVRRLLDTASDLLSSVRDVAAELRPPVLENAAEFGLGTLLESMVVDFGRRAGLPIELDVSIDPGDVDRARAETAYHVVREALTNVVAHAAARRARVVARAEGGVLHLLVADDGQGISPAAAEGPRALGILGIRERVLGWGGDVVIRGGEGNGTTLEARIPLHGPVPEEARR